MLPISSYPKLSVDTIANHDGITCWCIPTGLNTVSKWQDILDDGDDEIIFTNIMNPDSHENIVIVSSTFVSSTVGFTTIRKKSYNTDLTVLLTFKHVDDDSIGRIFDSGILFTGTKKYKIIEYNRHYILEKEKYISHCIYKESF